MKENQIVNSMYTPNITYTYPGKLNLDLIEPIEIGVPAISDLMRVVQGIRCGEYLHYIAALTSVLSKGTATISLLPGEKGILHLKLDNYTNADALYLTAKDSKGKEIFTWSWAIHSPKQIAEKANAVPSSGIITTEDNATVFSIGCDGIVYRFNKQTGFLQQVLNGNKEISLSNGPSLAGVSLSLTEFKTYEQGDEYIVEPVYKTDDQFKAKWTFAKGKLPQLDNQ